MSGILTLPLVAKPAPDSHYEWDIDDANGVKVAEVLAWDDAREPLPAEARAKHIVQAVNAFPALVAALANLVDCHKDGGFVEPNPEILDAARAALALTEAQP